MKQLNYGLKQLCYGQPIGSRATQVARERGLQLIADQLQQMGYKMKTPKALKPKHIVALVNRWHGESIGIGTIKNRMGHIRFWAKGVNKLSVVSNNEELGIERRCQTGADKAQRLNLAKVAAIESPHVRLSLRLQAAFGLRREEAIKFRPQLADKGDHIALKPSWTKGGRFREVPVVTKRQRALLDEVKAFAKGGSLIPDGKTYIKHLKTYEHQTLNAGLKNNHGLRHNFAQWRYKKLTGWACPLKGGKSPKDMTPREVEADKSARMIISDELGHGRLEITNVYLGGRQ